VCGRLSYRTDHVDFCAGCRKSTNECVCYDPVFGRPTVVPSSRSPSRPTPPESPSPAFKGFDALRFHARAAALDYLSRLIGGSPVSSRMVSP
jgi:hypothetical protein